MKMLGLLGLVLLLAALLAPGGHGAKQRVGHCLRCQPPPPVHIIRSSRAVLTPKIVRPVPTNAR
ncbi:MAG: hypothetical protein EOO62_28320 [Hymenobacter sp.]|nr:MAG: hypothetical protein EOO62_28320 [Hymenobacter sp.]